MFKSPTRRVRESAWIQYRRGRRQLTCRFEMLRPKPAVFCDPLEELRALVRLHTPVERELAA